jgi:hypothetical protein
MTKVRSQTSSIIRLMLSALRDADYDVQSGVRVGVTPEGGPFVAKILASRSGDPAIVISGHSQRRRGSAEDKIPWEAINLAAAIASEPGKLSRGYIVLAGSGWTLRDFFVRGGLSVYLRGADRVNILTLDSFLEKVGTQSL